MYEENSKAGLEDVIWTVVAIHDAKPEHAFEFRTPRLLRFVFLRNIYYWFIMFKMRSSFDVVIARYLTFDPFLIIAGAFFSKRFSLHHSKEINELRLIRPGWQGKLASNLEKFTGYVNSKQVSGYLGVTKEIALYRKALYTSSLPAHTYPNAIIADLIEPVDDRRDAGVEIAFVCGTFTLWHGLDRLIDSVESWGGVCGPSVRVHLIGSMSDELKQRIAQSSICRAVMVVHGHKALYEYRGILAGCDVGLGSLAMDRQDLTEGATLKVREYLAQGLPVYASHRDTALPENYRYFRFGPVDFEKIISFAIESKDFQRMEVRESARPFTEKLSTMNNLVDWLRDNNVI